MGAATVTSIGTAATRDAPRATRAAKDLVNMLERGWNRREQSGNWVGTGLLGQILR